MWGGGGILRFDAFFQNERRRLARPMDEVQQVQTMISGSKNTDYKRWWARPIPDVLEVQR